MVNGPTIGDAIAHPQGVIAKTVAAGATNEKLIETIYLSAEESARAAEYFATAGEPKAAGEDLMWALINSPGFLFNR